MRAQTLGQEELLEEEIAIPVLVFFFLAYFTLYNRLQFHPPH